MPEETRAKISASHLGKHLSAETRAKLSTLSRGRHAWHLSAQQRARLIEIVRHPSEETRAKMSTAAKERWAKSHSYNNTKETNDK